MRGRLRRVAELPVGAGSDTEPPWHRPEVTCRIEPAPVGGDPNVLAHYYPARQLSGGSLRSEPSLL